MTKDVYDTQGCDGSKQEEEGDRERCDRTRCNSRSALSGRYGGSLAPTSTAGPIDMDARYKAEQRRKTQAEQSG